MAIYFPVNAIHLFSTLKLYRNSLIYTNYHINYHILVSNVLIIDNNYLKLQNILFSYYYNVLIIDNNYLKLQNILFNYYYKE